MALKGVCPKCGVTYYGWALENTNNQRCENCNCDLAITVDGAVQDQSKGIETIENESDDKE